MEDDNKDLLFDEEQEVLDYSPASFNSQSNSLRREKLSKNRESLNPKDKVKNAAGNTMKTAGNVEKAAGNTMAAAGEVGSAAAKGAQVAGKGLQAGGKAVEAGTSAAGAALSAIPVVGTAAGAAVTGAGKVVGKGSQALGKGAEVAGKGAEKASDATKKAGNNLKKKGQSNIDAGNKIKNSTKKGTIKNEGNIVSDVKEKFTDRLKTKLKNNAKDAVNVDVTKQVFKKIKKKIVIYLGIGLLGLVLLLVLIEIIFGPLIEAIQWMDEKWDIIADKEEKVNNLYRGFGLQTTKEAFYEELDYLYEEYDHQIDIPLIMATLFYKEQASLYTQDFGTTALSDAGEIDDVKDSSILPSIRNMLESKYKDLYEDLDEDGKNYTVGKIYRLRKIARNQMNTEVFGEPIPTDTETIPYDEFLERSRDRLDDDVAQVLESLGSLTPTNFLTQFKEIIYNLTNLVEGNENLDTIGTISEPTLAINNLIKEFFITGSELCTTELTMDGLMVTIYKYEYNEDNFKNYLREYYIKNMPEFQEDVRGLSGDSLDREVDKIIKQIYEYAENYKELYDYEDPDLGEYDSDTCIGNVHEDVVNAIKLPVKESDEYIFEDENAFGVFEQKVNNGVNLTEESAGVKEGDDVYSILAGTVTEVKKSVKCNTKDDPSCDSRGNYVIIKHDKVQVEGVSTTLYSYYYNLKEKSVKVKKGEHVKKGTVIGQVGKTGDAEVAGLHFELHTDNKTLNPTNIFITCENMSSDGSSFPLHTATLSREEFIKKVKTACSKVTCSKTAKKYMNGLFIKNAGMIYDTATKHKLNPEFVVVRAFNEGFSPGDSKNNYWGIGCTNTGGYAACTSYSSFKNGIIGLANLGIIKNSDTLEQAMSHYAYIGANWYNPGSSSDGGCYYFPYIKEYMKPSRVTKVNNACAKGKTCYKTNCMKTSGEDQEAYTKWQISQNLLPYKNKIFGTVKNSKSSKSSGGAYTASANSSNSKKIEAYLSQMKKMANDNKIGYSQSTRLLNPNVDCTSFVYYGLVKSKVIKKESYPFATASMHSVMIKNGFKRIKYDKSKLRRGDIIMYHHSGNIGHATTYLGDNKEVAAHGCQGSKGDCSKNGDQNQEVSVRTFYPNPSYQWIYRLK